MRVKNIAVNNNFVIKASSEEKSGPHNIENSFRDQLRDISCGNMVESLKTLAEDIIKQGEIVCKRCDVKELKKYKELISSFLKEAVEYSYEFEKESKFDEFGRHKLYSNIKKINEKLNLLTEEVLGNQKETIEILKNVEDIKGLILDILL
jgi:uncharacterized protein YaaR (DUF327 family)